MEDGHLFDALQEICTRCNYWQAFRVGRIRGTEEGDNGPTTPEADEILYKKGVHIITDILANAGGVYRLFYKFANV